MNRRQFLTSSGAAAAAALAGCAADDGGTGQTDNDSPENDSSAPTEDTAVNDSTDEPESDGTEPEDSGTTNDEPDSSTDDEQTDDAEPDIEITSQALVEDDYGDAFVGGDIQNRGDAPSGYVEIVAYFYDEDGDELAGDTGVGNHYAYADAVEPGESMVFEIVTWIDYADVADYELAIEGL